jgi:hypothetical protein
MRSLRFLQLLAMTYKYADDIIIRKSGDYGVL